MVYDMKLKYIFLCLACCSLSAYAIDDTVIPIVGEHVAPVHNGYQNITSVSSQTSVPASANAIYVPLDKGIDAAILDAYLQISKSSLLDKEQNPDLLNAIADATTEINIENNLLKVAFDTTKLQQVQDDFSQALFAGIKSPVMAFVVLNQQEGNVVADSDGYSVFLQELSKNAKDLNYDLLYPLMDLTDLQTFNQDSVLAHNEVALAKAANRYGSEYFMTATLKEEGDNFVTVIWNFYTKEGTKLGSSKLSGDANEMSVSLSTTLAQLISSAKQGGIPAAIASENDASTDNLVLGPHDGLVRISISEVKNLSDLANIKRILIGYGYENDIKVVAIQGSSLIFEIPTNSSPAILDGTMRNAKDFSKIGSWQYSYLRSQQ